MWIRIDKTNKEMFFEVKTKKELLKTLKNHQPYTVYEVVDKIKVCCPECNKTVEIPFECVEQTLRGHNGTHSHHARIQT